MVLKGDTSLNDPIKAGFDLKARHVTEPVSKGGNLLISLINDHEKLNESEKLKRAEITEILIQNGLDINECFGSEERKGRTFS